MSLVAKTSRKFFSIAAIATVISIGPGFTATVQAAIVGGQISGTWQDATGGMNGLDVGTAFTADYTYDSSFLMTRDVNPGNYSRFLVSSAPLLSLVVNSGAFSYAFDLNGMNNFEQYDIQGGPVSSEFIDTGFLISAIESAGSGFNRFSARRIVGQLNGNMPVDTYLAQFAIDNNNNPLDGAPIYAQTNRFVAGAGPSPTPVPTPALLPGLIGLGMAALRKRKAVQN